MLKHLPSLCLLFIVVLNLFFLVTEARRIRLEASDGDCGKRKGLNGWPFPQDEVSLDSNHQGEAYLHYSHDGNHQKWELTSENGFYQLKNIATGLFLDSDHGGNIYTHRHNGGDFQRWRMIHFRGNSYWFKNLATGRQLDCHRYKAYTWPPNDERSQRWYVINA